MIIRLMVIALVLGVGGVAGMTGYWSYKPVATTAGATGDRPRRGHRDELDTAGAKAAARIARLYAPALGMLPPPPPPVAAVPASADPIDALKFAGVVERNGQKLAVFHTGTEDMAVLAVPVGAEVAPSWRLKSISASSVVVEKSGVERTFALFQ